MIPLKEEALVPAKIIGKALSFGRYNFETASCSAGTVIVYVRETDEGDAPTISTPEFLKCVSILSGSTARVGSSSLNE